MWTKKFGSLLKALIYLLMPVAMLLWPIVSIICTILTGIGFGVASPLIETFEAFKEGVQNKFTKCFTAGTWSSINRGFIIVRDFKDICFHSYFSVMDGLLEARGEAIMNMRIYQLPGCLLAGILGVILDVPLISLIVLYKVPVMLFKGWRQLILDLIGRSGPFLESVCVPFSGLLILLWPVAVGLAAVAGIISSLILGCYAAAVAHQENSTMSGILYLIAVISLFDEFTNDFLYMREGSCFPRPRYREAAITASPTLPVKKAPTEAVSFPLKRPLIKSASAKIQELQAVVIWENFFKSCERVGKELVQSGAIHISDLEEWKISKNKIVNIGLPTYIFLQCCIHSIKSGSVGFVMSDNVEVTIVNRPEGKIFDWLFEPMLVVKEQIKISNLDPAEEGYLYKHVLYCGDSRRIISWQNGGVPPAGQVKRAQLEGFSRRLQGFSLTVSRIPTFRRRFEGVVKAALRLMQYMKPYSDSISNPILTALSLSLSLSLSHCTEKEWKAHNCGRNGLRIDVSKVQGQRFVFPYGNTGEGGEEIVNRVRTPEMTSTENVVVVAVRAEREISKTALAWALTHVVRPGDLVTLLAVLADREATGWRRRLLWGFPRLGGGDRRNRSRERCQISASCSQMTLQIDGRNEINVRIKVVGSDQSASSSSSSGVRDGGVVVAESKRVGANWIVLDKQLKQEEKHCMEELQCNIVVIKGSGAKVLRLNLGGIHNQPLPPFSLSSTYPPVSGEKFLDKNSRRGPKKEISSPAPVEDEAPTKAHMTPAETKTVALTSCDAAAATSSFFVREHNPLFEKLRQGSLTPIEDMGSDEEDTSDSESNGFGGASPSSSHPGMKLPYDESCRDCSGSRLASTPAAAAQLQRVYWIAQKHPPTEKPQRKTISKPSSTAKTSQEKKDRGAETFRDHLRRSPAALLSNGSITDQDCSTTPYSSDVREAVSLFGSSPSVPPPLCSLCRHKAPVFGKPPRRFTYRELEVATDGFSDATFVAEGGGGCVHRGVLEDGRVVAVKRLKAGGGKTMEGDDEEEFCEEVEVLSRAQHRNVVMLVGFCVEGTVRVLVFEFICNGSLDHHLNGQGKTPLDWIARVRIAVGVARGLRYLHEDCRVGFVVHKDMRPNNILLTHDFEPVLGDFRLTRWQTETSLSVDTNLPEAFGYLAPEYIEHGIITDKSDVYAFGVVLLELITGRRALDTNLPKGQQFLVEWARPLMSLASEDGQTIAVDRFVDPHLDRDQARFFSQELRAMARAASLCLRREPQSRPGMSKVLRILEGDSIMDQVLDVNTVGSRSGRMIRPAAHQDMGISGSLSYRFTQESVVSALSSQKSWPHHLY
ncbi:hypothetical protein Cni_G11813 [Canna indica]|uniref:Protein kinase domain-containing protein n=1 Tax=Canna indica TaxID=4628 RepID=A0AAQ3K6P8_9LILI|nr:hypothetical protein Cni_G11813 [Canna indica]